LSRLSTVSSFEFDAFQLEQILGPLDRVFQRPGKRRFKRELVLRSTAAPLCLRGKQVRMQLAATGVKTFFQSADIDVQLAR